MNDQSDLNIPLSQLRFETDQVTYAALADCSTIQIGAMLQHVVQRHAASVLDGGTPMVVSVTFDASIAATPGADIRFESRIDRRTRTLVFASGTAAQDDRHLLKATVVFRIT